MKTIVTLTCMFISIMSAHSQSYTLLANDAAGDNGVPFIADIRSLSMRMDLSQDSLWFKLETWNAIDPLGDFGLMLGLDTDMNNNDGLAWIGNNTSMNYDQALIVFQDFVSPNYYGYTFNSSGSSWLTAHVERPDSFTFIINVPLSSLDSDGNFNLLVGTGAFDILSTRTVFDEIPDLGYLTISSTTGIIQPYYPISSIRVFPNPSSQFLYIENYPFSNDPVEIGIYSLAGKEILRTKFKIQEPINIQKLTPGLYCMKIFNHAEKVKPLYFEKIKD